MVARVRREPSALVVVFARDAEQVDELYARDGHEALRQAFALLARREFLLSGDTLTVRRPADQPPPEDLPEPSRSSHFS
jgi:hypothetical protein